MSLIDEEFEEMGRTKLFDPIESRKIRSIRRQFEHKISSVASRPSLQDYKDYIKHEKSVLNDVKARKKNHEAKTLEITITNRIKNLYETALRKFPIFDLCLSFFTFCKKANYTHAVSSVVKTMIQNHSSIPEAWQIAAKWYAYEEHNVAKAVQVARRGLEIHRNSKLLYKECIQLEVYECSQRLQNWYKKPLVEPIPEEIACIENLKIYVNELINKNAEYEYLLEILEMLEEYRFTISVQDIIVKHLRENDACEVEVWHVLAQRENKGLFYPSDQQLSTNSLKSKLKLYRCCEIYKEGLKQVPEPKKGELWSHYLDFLLQQCEDDFASFKISKKDMLLNALEHAYDDDCLLENHFTFWLEYGNEKDASQILEKGLKNYPDSLQLWQLRFKCEIDKGDLTAVGKVFQRGAAQLGERSLTLWTAILQYYLLYSKDDLVEGIFKQGVEQPPAVSDVLKQRYLEWLTVTKGIEAARAQYSKMVNKEPFCKGMHMTMARLESYELHSNLTMWEQVYKIACEQFKEDVEIWINYFQFLHNFKKETTTTLQETFMKAKNSLSDTSFMSFEDAYKRMICT